MGVKSELQAQPRFAVLDIKTTGFGRDDRILEIGVVVLSGTGEQLRRWRTLVRPGEKLQAYPQAKLALKDLLGAPTFADIAQRLAQLLDDAIIVAHNAAFEKRYLVQEFARVGATIPAYGDWDIDTHRLAEQYLNLSSYRLRDCVTAIGGQYSGAGDALSEAIATASLFSALHKRAGSTPSWTATPLVFDQRELSSLPTSRMPLVGRADGLYPDAVADNVTTFQPAPRVEAPRAQASRVEAAQVQAPRPPIQTAPRQATVPTQSPPAVVTTTDKSAVLAQWLAATGYLETYRLRLSGLQLSAMPKSVHLAIDHSADWTEQLCGAATAEIAQVLSANPAYPQLVDRHLVAGIGLARSGREMAMSTGEVDLLAGRVQRALRQAGPAVALLRAAIPFRFGSKTTINNVLATVPGLAMRPGNVKSRLIDILPHTFDPTVESEQAWHIADSWIVAGYEQLNLSENRSGNTAAIPEIAQDGARGLYVRDGMWQLLLTLSEGMLRADKVALPRGIAQLYQLGSGQSIVVASDVGKHQITHSFGMVTLTGIRAAAMHLGLTAGDRCWIQMASPLHFEEASPRYLGLQGAVGTLNAIGMDDRVSGRVEGGRIVVDSQEVLETLATAVGVEPQAPRRKVLQRLKLRGEGEIAELIRAGI